MSSELQPDYDNDQPERFQLRAQRQPPPRWTPEALAAKREAEAFMARLTPEDPVIAAARRVAVQADIDASARRRRGQAPR